ncbi:MAG: phosphoribosylformylglycinamidine synthase subunit PurL [Candidatus Omnitrophota bacterium]
MIYRIEIKNKRGIFDALGCGIARDIQDLGIKSVAAVYFTQVYNIEGDITRNEAEKIAKELLTDEVFQGYRLSSSGAPAARKDSTMTVEVAYNAGVMEPSEESILKGISDLGVKGVISVKSARLYTIKGKISPRQLKTISEKLLYNKLIQHVVKPVSIKKAASLKQGALHPGYKFNLVTVDLLGASDRKLREISRKGQLFLNLTEMRQIKNYFQRSGCNPTDCELETIAQTWSEHCMHKTFRGKIRYSQRLLGEKGRGKQKVINNLLKSTIMRATRELNKPWCVSVFKDNAGVIRFDEKYNACFKVETHNHPSALEPFGGANTGVGGVIRDPMGTGLGAKPVLNTDVFCFGPVDYPFSSLPAGALHPKRIMKGVVSGVRDYGNKMGIPTVNGAVLFDKGFVGNPLVYCGTVGILPRDKSFKHPKKGEFIVVVGGKTGRDGIHGATFSSGELTHQSEEISSGAVQIGNPIQEKKMLDALLKARDAGLYSAITDCGAGGLSSAVGEMGQELGARVCLEEVPLKYKGLSYTEIWISESQERMVLSVPRNNIARLKKVFDDENVEATVIGEFTGTGRLELYYEDSLVCRLDMRFLHDGLPQIEKKAVFIQSQHKEPRPAVFKDLKPFLLKLLGRYDICSKEWVIRQYDHEVQGGSVLKPLVGISNDGPTDAAVVRPVLSSRKGLIVSNGINFRYGFIDPYWMAASCIDEALRQIISVGGSLERAAILDNFCWGNPDKPDRLGSLVRAALGCYDTAKGFGVPFISGKDSLNNEYKVNRKSLAIPGTLLISAMAVMDTTDKVVSMEAKNAGDLVYAVGYTYNELGGSHYYDLLGGFIGNNVPRVYPKAAKRIFQALSKVSSLGLVQAMHDCSEGGIGVALAEMAFSGGLGVEAFLSGVPCRMREGEYGLGGGKKRNDLVLFSESNSRFILEVKREHRCKLERVLTGLPFGIIGHISQNKELRIRGLDGEVCLSADISELKEAWQAPLRW